MAIFSSPRSTSRGQGTSTFVGGRGAEFPFGFPGCFGDALGAFGRDDWAGVLSGDEDWAYRARTLPQNSSCMINTAIATQSRRIDNPRALTVEILLTPGY
jgi:hypothetical protein